jgi:hypothetical protein
MEQLRPILAGLKKYHFWILAGVCVIALLYCWNSAVSEVETQFKTSQQKVTAEFGKITTLQGKGEFPNENWATETKKKAEEVASQVNNASRTIIQTQESSFVWGDAFRKEFRDNAAAKPPAEWDDEFVGEFIAVMPEEIKRLKTVMGAAQGPNQPGTIWADEDFDQLLKNFEGLADLKWDTGPRKARIDALKHGYWLYENLARIIAAANQQSEKLAAADQALVDAGKLKEEDAHKHDEYNLPIHNVVELAIEGGATLKPEKWQIAGGEPVPPTIKVPETEGYVAKPVRIKVRMKIERLSWLLAACANADLPVDVLGVRIEKPRRLVEVEPPKDENRPRGGVRPGGGFQRFRPPGPGAKDKEKEEEEEEKPEFGRGTLVEIYGVVYVAEEKDFLAKIADTSAPDGGALVQR